MLKALPDAILPVLHPFATLFRSPTWLKAQILAEVGAILAPGQRTVDCGRYAYMWTQRRPQLRSLPPGAQSGGVVAPSGGWHPARADGAPACWTRAMVREIFGIDETLERQRRRRLKSNPWASTCDAVTAPAGLSVCQGQLVTCAGRSPDVAEERHVPWAVFAIGPCPFSLCWRPRHFMANLLSADAAHKKLNLTVATADDPAPSTSRWLPPSVPWCWWTEWRLRRPRGLLHWLANRWLADAVTPDILAFTALRSGRRPGYEPAPVRQPAGTVGPR